MKKIFTNMRCRVGKDRYSLCLLFMAVLLGAPCRLSAQELSQAHADYVWSFPRDHGSHPSYQIEWWYYTGQLYAEGREQFRDAPEFGFQLTFFRKTQEVSGTLVSDYMAHAALTDIASGATHFSSRIGGGALGIATASHNSLNAASGDWTVDSIGESIVLRFSLQAAEQSPPVEVRMLTAELPPVWLQGVRGMSRKAACQGCASMYYSMPRIPVRASVGQEGARRNLHGVAWMDHEFMTNSLGKSQVGWDWFGLMLKDGRSLMLFQLRNDKGGIDFSSGGIRKGEVSKVLTKDDFRVTPLRRWRSPQSGAEYPIEWRVVVPEEGIDTVVRARTKSCEVGKTSSPVNAETTTVRYWEGPVAAADESVIGYLEMTGYSSAITGVMANDASPVRDSEQSSRRSQK